MLGKIVDAKKKKKKKTEIDRLHGFTVAKYFDFEAKNKRLRH